MDTLLDADPSNQIDCYYTIMNWVHVSVQQKTTNITIHLEFMNLRVWAHLCAIFLNLFDFWRFAIHNHSFFWIASIWNVLQATEIEWKSEHKIYWIHKYFSLLLARSARCWGGLRSTWAIHLNYNSKFYWIEVLVICWNVNYDQKQWIVICAMTYSLVFISPDWYGFHSTQWMKLNDLW